ncbi:hypothetical protein ABZ806_36380 [Spirillospora sp. NPDC047418]
MLENINPERCIFPESGPWYTSLAFGRHDHRLAQPTAYVGQEPAQDVHSLLALQFAKVDIEVDLLGGPRTEDHQHPWDRPDLQVSRPDQIEQRLPVLHRGARRGHIRQRFRERCGF